jgi:hypothetical protein
MTVQHTIKKRLDLPMSAADLNEFASEVLASNPDAPIGAQVLNGGDQRDPYPIAVVFTASWEN